MHKTVKVDKYTVREPISEQIPMYTSICVWPYRGTYRKM